MAVTALQRIESEPDYDMFVELMSEGHTDMSNMAKIIFTEYDRVMPGRIKSAAVMRVRLYNFAKRTSFVKDKDDALRGLRVLHTWQVYNANLNEAMNGNSANIKLHYQHEEGWSEKTEVKSESIINADALISGLMAARKKMNANLPG